MLLGDSTRPARLYNDLVAASDKLLAHDPKSYDGLRIKGNLAVLDGKPDVAISFFSQANSVKPMQPALIATWSRTLLEGARAPEGEQLALSLIREQKTYGPIYDILFRYYLRSNRPGDAENILQARVDNNPGEIDFALSLAGYYAITGKKDAMTAIISGLTKDPKTFPGARLRTGDFYTTLQDLPAALEEYREGGRTASKDRITYLKRIADTLVAEGKGEEAAGVVAEILRAKPRDEAARAVNASLLVGSGKPDKMDAGVRELSGLVSQSPANPVWRYDLGLALMAKGDMNGAAAQLEEAIKNRPDFLPPRLTLSQINYLRRDYDKTLSYADEILAAGSENGDVPLNSTAQLNYAARLNSDARLNSAARLMRAAALTGLHRYSGAHSELSDLEKTFPDDPEVQFQIVALDVAEKEFTDAERRIQKLSAEPATQTRALAGMVIVYGDENRLETALKLLTEESKKSPGSDAILTLLGNTALRLGRYDQALASYQELLRKNPKASELYRLIGSAYEGKGDRAKALECFEQAANLAPGDPAAVAGLADLLRMAGREPEAIVRYRRLLQLDTGSATAMNNLAWLLADTGGNLEEAERLEQRALQLIPNEPSFADTLGVIYTKKKQNGSSVHVFETLVGKYPEEPIFHYHFGLALMEGGYKEKAKAELETALLKNPSDDVRKSIGLALGSVAR
jgi:predicted Zn-dependent protease